MADSRNGSHGGDVVGYLKGTDFTFYNLTIEHGLLAITLDFEIYVDGREGGGKHVGCY